MFVERFLLYGTFQNTMLRFRFLLFLLFDPAVWEVVGVWEGGVAGGLLSRGWLLAGGVVWEVWSLWFLSRIRCDLLVAARCCGASCTPLGWMCVGGAELGGWVLLAVALGLAEADAVCAKLMGLVCGMCGR